MTATGEFPFCPEWLAEENSAGVPCGLRPFGASAEDLGVEFRAGRRAELITELLARCCQTSGGAQVDQQVLLRMPVGMRTEALLTLASLADPAPFCWQTHCASQQCGREIEFELALEQIVSLGNEQRGVQTWKTEIGDVEVLLRRPTGLDQIEWLAQPVAVHGEAMLRSILVRPSLEELVAQGESSESIAVAVDEAMDSFDPLVGFHLSVVCPDCSGSVEVFPDLAGSALERLSHAQQSLIEDVHCLASRYHWSEEQVFRLPEWRRQRYLELIEEAL